MDPNDVAEMVNQNVRSPRSGCMRRSILITCQVVCRDTLEAVAKGMSPDSYVQILNAALADEFRHVQADLRSAQADLRSAQDELLRSQERSQTVIDDLRTKLTELARTP